MVTRLSVNINKFATLRNARGGNNPDLIQTALNIEKYGADGITVHPRPDGRHIKYQDVIDLKSVLTTEFNIEGNPTPEFIELVNQVKPHQVTLVPDATDALTSNAGWDTITHQSYLYHIISQFKEMGIRVSIFCDADIQMIEGASKTNADRIELYTGPYANQFLKNPEMAIKPYIEAATVAQSLGLGLNAGHDLDLNNLKYFKDHISNLSEVSIGHALICDALYFGIEKTVQLYKGLL